MRSTGIKPFYNTIDDDIIKDFYNPLLSVCKKYKRVSAYFDSKILSLYSRGLEKVVENNAQVEFIFSHELNEKDFNDIKLGYKHRSEKFEELSKFIDADMSDELSNLGYLIKNQFVNIKIAFTKNGGIFHDKFGIFEYNEDSVYFRGSNNETFASVRSNFESFETTCSWNSNISEILKINNAKKMFELLWNNNYSEEIMVYEMPKVIEEKLISFSKGKLILNQLIDENYVKLDYDEKLILTNLLERKILISPQFNFYKRALEAYVDKDTTDNEVITFNNKLGYIKINKIISDIKDYANKKGFNVLLTDNLLNFITEKELHIQKRRSMGIAIKERMSIINDDFLNFQRIVNLNMERSLRVPQIWDAYHIIRMLRSANFSVPGSGKTSIVYGAFAYLNHFDEVDKIVMVGPLNSFSSWINEFKSCFGSLKKLKVFDYQKEKNVNPYLRYNKIVHQASQSNLILFNYESLQSNLDAIKSLVNSKTLVVFDEVHRIKSIKGIRAQAALQIGIDSKYRVVLTGTPIPNGYIDLFNLLNILFTEEYDLLFSFDKSKLESGIQNEELVEMFNNQIYPFFCRTDKDELEIPKPEPDNLTDGYQLVSSKERELFKLIYYKFSQNYLVLYIRLIQASNNPSLILNKIEEEELKLFDTHDFIPEFSKIYSGDKNLVRFTESETQLIKSFDMTSKFHNGINLIETLALKGKVIVWGIFVKTLNRIEEELLAKGIKAKVISGKTNSLEREEILNDFEFNELEVLITNPHTLGESISLHKACHQAVYFELSFNLVHFLQSKDRIHRLGLSENEKTNYYFMLSDDPDNLYSPIDVKIYNRLIEKETIQKNAISNRKLTYFENDIKEDIEFLFGYNR